MLFFILRATIDFEDIMQIENPAIGLAARLMAVNIILVVFNMIPAFPMDGGRVLRALLAMRMPAPKATADRGAIGQFAAFAFALIGLFWNPILLIIAIFVYLARLGGGGADGGEGCGAGHPRRGCHWSR